MIDVTVLYFSLIIMLLFFFFCHDTHLAEEFLVPDECPSVADLSSLLFHLPIAHIITMAQYEAYDEQGVVQVYNTERRRMKGS